MDFLDFHRSNMSSTPRIRVGLVGFGISGRVFHAPFLHKLNEQFELKSVVERHTNEAEKIYPNIKTVRSTEDLFNDPEIDLVVITTANDLHYSLSRAALEKGKHVVVEKPMTIRSVEAQALIDLAKEKGLILCPYQNRRYTSGFRTIKQIVDEKLLGEELVECELHFDRYRPELKGGNAWRERNEAGGGIFYDLGSHLLDQALTLFGHPQTITADIRIQRPIAHVDDYFDVRLDYGRLRVTLKAGMLVRELGPRYTLHGLKGSFLKYGDDIQEERLRAGATPNDPNWGQEATEHDGILHTETNEGQVIRKPYPTLPGDYGLFYKQLYAAIRQGQPLEIRPEDGFNVIRLIELGFQSNKEKRTIPCDQLL